MTHQKCVYRMNAHREKTFLLMTLTFQASKFALKTFFLATIGLTTTHQTVGLLTFQAVTPGPNAVAPVPNVTGPRRELKNNRIVLDYLTFKI